MLAQMESRQAKLTDQNKQLQKDFEESEDNLEQLKSDYEDLKEQLVEKCNDTVNREIEERCFALTSEIDELSKKHHYVESECRQNEIIIKLLLIISVELASTKKDLENANEKLANTKEQFLNEKEEHQAEFDELQEKVIFYIHFPDLIDLLFSLPI